jgi:hypothetical protein
VGISPSNEALVQTGVSQTKMEPSSCLGPHQRARVAIRKEIDINTDDNAKQTKSNLRALAAQNKTDDNGKGAKTHHASKGLFVKRESKKQWGHSYTDVTVVKYDLSYREDVFRLPHTKRILLSDL